MRCPKCGLMETRVLETRTAGEEGHPPAKRVPGVPVPLHHL